MNQWLYQTWVAPLGEPFFQKALIGGAVVAVVCGVVGCLVILRRMAFLGDAISHAMIAGVGGGYLLMKLAFGVEAHAPGMLVGSLIAALVTVGLIGFVSRVSRVKEDAAIGIMYTGIFAGGVVLVSVFRNHIHIDLMHFIMGDVLGVTNADLWVAAFVAAFVLSLIVLFFRHFQLASFDPVMAASIGLPVLLIDYALTICVSMVVVSAVSMVGVILVVGLLITPAATAYLLSDRLSRMMVLAGVFGVTSVVGGLYLCVWLDSAGGGAIMLVCTLQFVLVLFAAPHYGILARWRRRRRMIPQQLLEDILKAVLQYADESVPMGWLAEHVSAERRQLNWAVVTLRTDGLLTVDRDQLALTDQGTHQARRIERAHRLWKAYLAQTGTPTEKLHERAELMEHLHDEASVDYLEHRLGHPLHDPHGAEIPDDFVDAVAGRTVQASLLREGREATVLSVGPVASGSGLQSGEAVRMGARRGGGATWVVVRADGTEVVLDHKAADALLVRPTE